MVKTENFEKVTVTSESELRRWLSSNHTQEQSIWLVTHKKTEGDKYVSAQVVLDALIAFGWIDGIRRKLNATQTMQLISPRKTQHWAKTYKDRAAKLIEQGKMTQAGRDAIARSKALGQWDFMADVDALIKPDDLITALKTHKGAMDFFNSLSPSNQRFVLRWIKLAKTSKTREKRIIRTAKLAAKGEKIPGI